MGVYISTYVNNNIFEQSFDYTINKISKMINKKIYLYIEHDKNMKYPEYRNEYIVVFLNYGNSIEEEEKISKCISINIYDELFIMEFFMTKSTIEFFCIDDMSDKWGVFEDHLTGRHNLFDKGIEKIIHFSKLFKSTELLIFGDDYYDDMVKELSEGAEINEVMNNLDLELNIVSNIPIENDNEIHVYYKKIEYNNDFDFNEWTKYFITE